MNGVSLTGTTKLEHGILYIDYEIVNKSPNALFVARLPRGHQLEIYPEQACTTLSSNHRSLNLFLGQSPIPPLMNLYWNPPPLLALIESHSSDSHRFILHTPVREWTINALPKNEDVTETVEIRDITISLDVMVNPTKYEAASGRYTKAAPPVEVLPLFDMASGGEYKILILKLKLDEKIQVLVRSRPFSRLS